MLVALLAAAPGAADDPFDIQLIEVAERAVQADLVDLDGDGHGDLLWTSVTGVPPEESRTLHVHYGDGSGSLPPSADWSTEVPSGVAAYDLANLDGRAGDELLWLRSDRLTRLSLHGRAQEFADLPVPVATIAASQDERGLDRLALARPDLGAPMRLLVPGLGLAALLETSGQTVTTLDVGARANFFVPPRPGPIISESEIEIYFDHPRLSSGDVDGDGRTDLITSSRHELRVFLQREGGAFTSSPDRSIALRRVSETDHIRSSGSVRVAPYDFDGDGRVDLMLSTSSGSLFGGTTELTLHMNRDGSWNLDEPDQRFVLERGFSTHDVIDLDGDGRAELVSVHTPTSVLEIVEILVTRAIDAEVTIYRTDGERPFLEKPWQAWKLGVDFSFDTFRPKGFIATLEPDLDGDGHRDLLGSGDGKRLEVSLGDPKKGFRKVSASQEMDTGGRIRFGNLEGDARQDFVLYDPRRPGTPIRVGRNRMGGVGRNRMGVSISGASERRPGERR